MLHFSTVTLRDKPWIDELFAAEDSRSADYNFGNVYIWDRRYRQLTARLNDRVLIRLRLSGRAAFAYPAGRGELKPVIDALRTFAAEEGEPLMLRGMTEEHRELVESLYPGAFAFEEDRDNEDYLYLASSLSTYSGKALHSKKNHCNRFEVENDWHFEPLTKNLIPGCLDMLAVWTEDNEQRLDHSVRYEHDAILRAFAAYDRLGMEGGVLYSGDRIVGFSLGEMTSRDTFDVHFEKAEIGLNGAYPMVCRELTRQELGRHPGLVYMNREDDMGLEALRTSKLSYRPEMMVKKYTGVWKDDRY